MERRSPAGSDPYPTVSAGTARAGDRPVPADRRLLPRRHAQPERGLDPRAAGPPDCL